MVNETPNNPNGGAPHLRSASRAGFSAMSFMLGVLTTALFLGVLVVLCMFAPSKFGWMVPSSSAVVRPLVPDGGATAVMAPAPECIDPEPFRLVGLKLSPGVDAPHLAGTDCLAVKPKNDFIIESFSDKLGFDSLIQATAFVQHARIATAMGVNDLSWFMGFHSAGFEAMKGGTPPQSAAKWRALSPEVQRAIEALRAAGVTAGGTQLLYAGVATGTKK